MSDLPKVPKALQDEPTFVDQTPADEVEVDFADERGGVPIRCQFCIGQTFRRSRLRVDDIRSLLLMRYPVRCTRCAQRQLVSFTIAGISLGSSVRAQRRRRSAQGRSSPGSAENEPANPSPRL